MLGKCSFPGRICLRGTSKRRLRFTLQTSNALMLTSKGFNQATGYMIQKQIVSINFMSNFVFCWPKTKPQVEVVHSGRKDFLEQHRVCVRDVPCYTVVWAPMCTRTSHCDSVGRTGFFYPYKSATPFSFSLCIFGPTLLTMAFTLLVVCIPYQSPRPAHLYFEWSVEFLPSSLFSHIIPMFL